MSNAHRWKQEFSGSYDIPRQIEDKVDTAEYEDISWHNDVCPSFVCTATMRRLWVEHPEPQMREWDAMPRYAVFQMDENYEAVTGHPLYEGDNLDVAMLVAARGEV